MIGSKIFSAFALGLLTVPLLAQKPDDIPMVQIYAGAFTMGAGPETLPPAVTNGFGVVSERPAHGDWDEHPAHKVTLTHGFRIAKNLITVQEFQRGFSRTSTRAGT